MCCMPRMRRKKNQTNLTNTWKSYRCETRHPPCCYTPRIYFPVQIYDRADICKYWDWFNLLKMGVDSFVMYVFVFVCVLCANLCYTRAWTHIIGLSFLCTCTAYRRLYTHKDWDLVSRALVFVYVKSNWKGGILCGVIQSHMLSTRVFKERLIGIAKWFVCLLVLFASGNGRMDDMWVVVWK